LLSAGAKFLTLWLTVTYLLLPLLALPEPQAATLSFMFSWPQLVTASIGGTIALAVTPLLWRALKTATA
ncbi:MAG: hypothetical protein FWE69_02070, partial [Clostridiales bacterium]|nr:hypothetical protein [Clostridiales bacterium]